MSGKEVKAKRLEAQRKNGEAKKMISTHISFFIDKQLSRISVYVWSK